MNKTVLVLAAVFLLFPVFAYAEHSEEYKICKNSCVDDNQRCRDKCENDSEIKSAKVKENDPKRQEKLNAYTTEAGRCTVSCYNSWAVCGDKCGRQFPDIE
jgi:hypothetical protein